LTDATIEVPQLGLVAVMRAPRERSIELVPRRTRGHTATVASRVSFGGPDTARMKPRPDEDRWLADRRENAVFWAILMSLTFEPVEPEKLTSAWLQVDLHGDGSGPVPIAFIMDPGRREEPMSVETSGNIEATVKVVKAGAATKRTYTLHEAEILAFNRLRSDPSWEITPSSGRPIKGGIDFVLVVKGNEGNGSGHVRFGATIEWTESRLLRKHSFGVSWKGDPAEFRLL
jgi:hypothetical protein